MVFVVERVIKGNKREVPPGLPPGLWWNKVGKYAADTDLLATLPWYNDSLEYLSPVEMARIKAKALVWHDITGEWPKDIAVWWEVRMARRRGDHPHTTERVGATIDGDGVEHCGYCGARWSFPFPERCKLCDRILVVEDSLMLRALRDVPRGLDPVKYAKRVSAVMQDQGVDQEEAKRIVKDSIEREIDDDENEED